MYESMFCNVIYQGKDRKVVLILSTGQLDLIDRTT